MRYRGLSGIMQKQLSIPLLYITVNQVKYISQATYVIISDCLHHDTVAVYIFQKCLVFFYFSDGSAAQYKIERISLTCIITKQISKLMPSGIFSLHLMEKGHAMA